MDLFFNLFAISSSLATICVCENRNCESKCPNQGLVVDAYQAGFYSAIMIYMGREKDILLLLGAYSEENSYRVEINIPFFIDRNLEVSKMKDCYIPRDITVTIDASFDFTSTSINIDSFDVDLQLIGKNKGKRILEFNSFKYRGKFRNTKEILGKLDRYSLYTNELSILASSLFVFQSVTVKSDAYPLVISAEKINILNVTISESILYISDENCQISIYYTLYTELQFTCNENLCVDRFIISLVDGIDTKFVPNISIDNISSISLYGNWQNIEEKTKLSINCIEITIFSFMQYFPFQINAENVSFYLMDNTTVTKQIKSANIAVFSMRDDQHKLTIVIESIFQGVLDMGDARINAIVIEYNFVFYDNNFPVITTFSDTSISEVVINHANFSTSENSLSSFPKFLFFRNSMTYAHENEDIRWLLDGLIDVLRLPLNLSDIFFVGLKFKYTNDSVKTISGLREADNILKLKIRTGSFISFYISDDPNRYSVVELCSGESCDKYQNIIEDPSDLFSSGFITENQTHYSYLNYPDDGVVTTIGLQNIPYQNLTFSFILNSGLYIVIFKPDIAAFEKVWIYNCNFTGDVGLYGKDIIIVGCFLMDPNSKVIIKSNKLSIDVATISLVRKVEEPINRLCIQLAYLNDEVKFFNFGLQVNEENITWDKIKYLTLLAYNNKFTNYYEGAFSGFNISICSNCEITLDEDWEKMNITNGIYFDLRGYDVKLTLKKPYLPQNLIFCGKGSYKIQFEYTNLANVCVYNEDSSLCNEDDLKISYEQFYDLHDLDSVKLIIHFVGFNESYIPEVDLSAFKYKLIEFVPTSEQDSHFLSIISNSNESFVVTSPLKFQDTKIYINNPRCNIITFYIIELVNSSFVSDIFRSMTLNTSVIICQYYNFLEWKNFTVNERIEVSGEAVDGNQTIIVPKTGFGNTLNINVLDNTTVAFGDGKIQIGGISFIISESILPLVNISILENITLSLECIEGTINIPKTSLSSNNTVTIYAKGKWPSTNYFINHTFYNRSNIYLESFFKYTARGFGRLDVYACSPNCGITGEVNLREFMVGYPKDITIYLHSNLDPSIRVNLSITRSIFLLVYDIPTAFRIMDYPIDLYLYDVIITTNLIFFAYNRMSKNGCSSITYLKELGNQNCQSMNIDIDIEGPLLDISEYDCFKHNYTIMTMKKDNVPEHNDLYFWEVAGPITHGFNTYPKGCFSFFIEMEGDFAKFVVYPIMLPSQIPYLIQYSTSGDFKENVSKKISNPEDISNAFEDVSKYIMMIKILLDSPVDPKYFLPLSKLSHENFGVNVQISGSQNDFYYDHLGSAVSDLYISDLVISQSNELFPSHLRSLSIENVQFVTNEISFPTIDEITIDMRSYSILNGKKLLPHVFRSLNITNANYITFCVDGWSIRSDLSQNPLLIRKSMVEHLTLIAYRTVSLDLERPYFQTLINSVPIYLDDSIDSLETFMMLGEGWESIININDMVVYSSQNKGVYVATSTYPIPRFNLKFQYSTTFNPLSSNYSLSNLVPISQDQNMNMYGDKSKHYDIYGKDLVIAESVQIKCNFNATIQLNTLKINSNASPKIFDVFVKKSIVLEPNTQLYLSSAAFDLRSNVEIHWKQDKWPLLYLDLKNSGAIPIKITINLNENKPNYTEYDNYTNKKTFDIIEGNFDCDSMVSRIRFNSSDSFFSDSPDLIFNIKCSKSFKQNNIISVFGYKELPQPKKPSEHSSKVQNTTVAAIAVSLALVLCALIGTVVFIITKRKYKRMLEEQMGISFKIKVPKKRRISELGPEYGPEIGKRPVTITSNDQETDTSSPVFDSPGDSTEETSLHYLENV